MQVHTIETITNIFDEAHNLIRTYTSKTLAISPDEGKLLKHRPTGKCYSSSVNLANKKLISEYFEIQKG